MRLRRLATRTHTALLLPLLPAPQEGRDRLLDEAHERNFPASNPVALTVRPAPTHLSTPGGAQGGLG